MQMTLQSQDGSVIDVYRQKFGIRSVNFSDTQLLINGKPFYCKGLGRHEDSDVSHVFSHFYIHQTSLQPLTTGYYSS